ncbi:MAG: tripartite tricarboxylate transporter substrate binding protein [Burkholderiales bacterium]|nr:tripartite tricarboxylate transporter substrate binding protein [Burkholderiales bacterium]
MTISASIRNLVAGVAALAACAGAAAQGAYPAGPVTVIVPFAAGGSVDVAARIVLPRLAERLKAAVVIENAPGAAGTIGTQRAVRARPDGQTLLFAVASPITVAPQVSPTTVKYDALKELAPIAPVGVAPFVLIGKPGLAAANTSDLVRLAKSQPGKLNYGTDGVGTSMHVSMELVKQNARIDVVHVPYKSGPQVLTELAGNQIDLAVLPVSLAQAFIRDGKVKAFGVTSKTRWASLPGVPSLAEAAELRDMDVESWYGLLAPAQVDAAIRERLAREIAAVLGEPDTVRRMEDAGLKPLSMTPAQFGAYLQREKQMLGAVISAAGIKTE